MEQKQIFDKNYVSGYALIINYLGIFSILIGAIMLSPLVLLIFWPQEKNEAMYFLIPACSAITIGLLTVRYFKGREKRKLERHQDAVLVVFTWLMAILFASFPFILSGQFTFTQGIFEATSGFSTTGLTIVNVEEISHIFLLYRSLLQFFGGVGLVLILTSAISDKFGIRLYHAEGHNDRLLPNLIKSARMILSIYIGYIIIGTIAYVFFGMGLFDAVNHSISAVATGGFSTKAASIGFYNHLGIEIVTMVLMILGGTNFFVHLMLIKGKSRSAIKHIEIKFLVILAAIFIPIFVIDFFKTYNVSFGNALRIGVFHFITTITTTGLQTISSVNILPSAFLFGVILLMMVGAAAGSTAGGIKLYRVALMFKSIYWHIKDVFFHKKAIHPKSVNRLGIKVIIDKDLINQNFSFILIYVFIQMIGIMIFTLHGYSVLDSVFEFTSTLGTIGLSVGIIGPNAPIGILWTGIVGMLIARLESFVIIIAIMKVYYDIKNSRKSV